MNFTYFVTKRSNLFSKTMFHILYSFRGTSTSRKWHSAEWLLAEWRS